MNFDQAFSIIIGHEGGYVNHKSDPGGETKYGISKRSYPQLEIGSLTEYDAKVIYKRDYWDKCKCDQLPDDVRLDVFDGAINSGCGQSIKWLQESIGELVDGLIGPKTIASCSLIDGLTIKAKYNGHRLKFMSGLSTWPAFGRGWAARIANNLMIG